MKKYVANQTALARFLTKFTKEPCGCWVWKHPIKSSGYGSFWLNDRKVPAQIAAFVIFKGNHVVGLDVAHLCDNRACVNPDHLVQMTHKENMNDSIQKKRHPTLGRKGSRNIQAKLTESDVKTIKGMAGLQREIARQFGVSRELIGYIKRGKIWTHVSAS